MLSVLDPELNPNPTSLKILILEDGYQTIKLLGEGLESEIRYPLIIEQVKHSCQALDRLRQEAFDLIVIHLSHTDSQVVDAVNSIKQLGLTLPILGLSANEKGNNDKFLVVSSDSVRVYIDTTGVTKGNRGGFAVGGLSSNEKGGIAEYMKISPSSAGDTVLGQPRFLWYPRKEAFLVGNVYVESADSVGFNAFVSGYRSRASGNYSQAMGYRAYATGDYATAIGNYLAGFVGRFYQEWELWQFFLLLIVCSIAAALMVVATLKKLKKATE